MNTGIMFETTDINGMALDNRFFRSATWEGMAGDATGGTDSWVRVGVAMAVAILMAGIARSSWPTERLLPALVLGSIAVFHVGRWIDGMGRVDGAARIDVVLDQVGLAARRRDPVRRTTLRPGRSGSAHRKRPWLRVGPRPRRTPLPRCDRPAGRCNRAASAQTVAVARPLTDASNRTSSHRGRR